jgi:predicted aspartyl protease
MPMRRIISTLLLLHLTSHIEGFRAPVLGERQRPSSSYIFSSSPQEVGAPEPDYPTSIANYLTAVVAPLNYIGPYSCLTLRFPHHSNQTFDFLLDTGANVNSLDAKLVRQLDLPMVRCLEGLPFLGTTSGSAGVKGGDLYLLGDCQLDGLPFPVFTFLRNLTAAALPYASPVGVGLLSLALFYSFPAGVEFDWYGTDGDPPSIIFYFGKPDHAPKEVVATMKRVPLTPLAVGVMTLNITMNGVELPALLDTGSPITVLNPQAAERVGVALAPDEDADDTKKASLKITGVDGGEMELRPSDSYVAIRAGDVSLGNGPVFVGNLPGLALMEQLGGGDAPAVVLGLDFLRRVYRMVLRVPDQEVWFEELNDQPRWEPPAT